MIHKYIAPLFFVTPAFLVCMSAFGQCPNGTTFPTQADTDASLTVAVNNLGTNLTSTLSPSSSSMIVSSTTGWVPNIMATVDTGANMEIVFVTSITSGTVLAISHPCEGTSAVSHNAGVPVVANVTAYAGSTGMKSAIKAIEIEILSGGPGGTVNLATQYQAAYYVNPGIAAVLGGDAGFTYTPISALLTATNISSGAISIPTITGTQCLHIISGLISGTGSDCGSSGGTGTVNSGAQYSMAIYPLSGSSATVGAATGFSIQGGVMTVAALNLGIIGSSSQCVSMSASGLLSGFGSPCGGVNSGTVNQVAYYAGTGTILSGHTGFTYNGSALTVAALNLGTLSGCLTGTSGVITSTGSNCASLPTGVIGEIPVYNTTTSIAPNSNLTFTSNTLFAPSVTVSSALNLSYIASGTQCLKVNGSGVVAGTGSACTSAAGATNEVAYYSSATGLTGTSGFNYASSTLTVPQISTTTIAATNFNGSNVTVTDVNAGSVNIGSTTLYRCTSGGAARTGAITAVAADCTTSVAVGILSN